MMKYWNWQYFSWNGRHIKAKHCKTRNTAQGSNKFKPLDDSGTGRSTSQTFFSRHVYQIRRIFIVFVLWQSAWFPLALTLQRKYLLKFYGMVGTGIFSSIFAVRSFVIVITLQAGVELQELRINHIFFKIIEDCNGTNIFVSWSFLINLFPRGNIKLPTHNPAYSMFLENLEPNVYLTLSINIYVVSILFRCF